MEDELLTESAIDALAIRVADGSATPRDARMLLAEFVARYDRKTPLPDVLIGHIHDCMQSFLRGHRILLAAARNLPIPVAIDTLDKAFGIARPFRGAPPTDPEVCKQVAMQVLAKRLAGLSLEQASAELESERSADGLPLSSDSQIRDAWREHKLDGYLWLRASRSGNVDHWSTAEQATLTKIFAKEPWWRPPSIW